MTVYRYKIYTSGYKLPFYVLNQGVYCATGDRIQLFRFSDENTDDKSGKRTFNSVTIYLIPVCVSGPLYIHILHLKCVLY